jgi:tetratricopeptide (TPR) repeat protein
MMKRAESSIPAETPPVDEAKPPSVDTHVTESPGNAAEDPLRAQGKAFWEGQRFDAPARAVYSHLCKDQDERETQSGAPWKEALATAESHAEMMNVINDARARPEAAAEIVRPHRKTAQGLCRKFPRSADLHIVFGTLALCDGDEKAAIIALERALSLGWKDLDVLGHLIHEVWENSVAPPSPEISLWWFDVCERAEDWEACEKAMRLIMFHRHRSMRDLERLRSTLENRPISPEAPAHLRQMVLVERARLAVWEGVATEALSLLEELKPEEITDLEIGVALGRTLIAHGDLRRAFDFLSNVPLNKTSKVLLNEIAMTLESQGDLEAAVYVLQHINSNDELVQNVVPPRDRELEAETAQAMAEWQLRQGRASSALGQYFRALALGLRDEGPVLKLIHQLLDEETNPEPYWQRLADHHAQHGDLYRALVTLRRIQGHPTYGPRARASLRSVLDRMMASSRDAPQLRLESGILHMLEQDYDRATEDLKWAARTPELEMQAHRHLALCHYHTGQFALALDLFHFVPLDAELIEALTAMSHQLEGAGLFREALEAARIIHSHDPLTTNIQDRVAYLTQRVNSAAASKTMTGDDRVRELLGDQAAKRYRYGSKIGSGGMGIVYKVFDNELNTHVALKVLRESLTSSRKAVERFFREARIAASLHHPNIVNIFDYSVKGTGGMPSHMTMEYVDGPSLREIIEAKFSSTVEVTVDDVLEALNCGVQLCDALHATHRQGIIHRDIKPDNIMINSSGVVKITDFGIVHVEEATFTPTGAMIGTPRYMSPEQVQGKRVDGRSDLYAVGIILYESLVGTPPFVSGDIAYQQVNVMPTRPREIVPVIPPEVDRIIMKCLEKQPESRHSDSRTLRRALADIYHELLPQGLTERSRLPEIPYLG